jgi:hypothetical protein
MANFAYIEVITPAASILDVLKAKIVDELVAYTFNATAGETEETNTWTVLDSTVDVATSKIATLTLKGTIKIGAVTKDFAVKFTNEGLTTPAKHSTLTVQLLEGITGTGSTATFANAGQPVTFEWSKQDFTPTTDRSINSPVYLFISVMNNRLAIVAVGDPAVNFLDYRKSFLYVGALKPFSYNITDVETNIALTAGAVTAPPTTVDPTFNFGTYTSYGNNTIQMFETKSGIKFQHHYPSFITQAPEIGKAYVDLQLGDTGLHLEPQGFNASQWTRKYHLSPIYIVHPYDGYRGQFDSCIAVSKNNILHLDELIVDIPAGTAGKTWLQEVYKYFDHNTEQNFMKKSANIQMGVAILAEVRY